MYYYTRISFMQLSSGQYTTEFSKEEDFQPGFISTWEMQKQNFLEQTSYQMCF